jgi:hypothetical protein
MIASGGKGIYFCVWAASGAGNTLADDVFVARDYGAHCRVGIGATPRARRQL